MNSSYQPLPKLLHPFWEAGAPNRNSDTAARTVLFRVNLSDQGPVLTSKRSLQQGCQSPLLGLPRFNMFIKPLRWIS